MFYISCEDVGVACEDDFYGETKEELIKKIVAHASRNHNLADIPTEVIEKIKSSIVEKDPPTKK